MLFTPPNCEIEVKDKDFIHRGCHSSLEVKVGSPTALPTFINIANCSKFALNLLVPEEATNI